MFAGAALLLDTSRRVVRGLTAMLMMMERALSLVGTQITISYLDKTDSALVCVVRLYFGYSS
jgi:hypothetical protein